MVPELFMVTRLAVPPPAPSPPSATAAEVSAPPVPPLPAMDCATTPNAWSPVVWTEPAVVMVTAPATPPLPPLPPWPPNTATKSPPAPPPTPIDGAMKPDDYVTDADTTL